MAYRDDRDALKDRISFLERQLANQVSPAKLETLRSEVAELKDRLLSEQSRLESISSQLAMPPGKAKRKSQALLFALTVVVLLLAVVVGLGSYLVLSDSSDSEPAPSEAHTTVEILPVELVRTPRVAQPSDIIDPFGDTPTPEPDSVRQAVEAVRPGLEQCGRPEPFRGSFRMTFDGTGTVQAVSGVAESAASDQGRCTIAALSNVRVPSFSDPTLTAVVPMVITTSYQPVPTSIERR